MIEFGDIDKAIKEIQDKKEACLLAFFGSYENAQRMASDYILEEYPLELDTQPWQVDSFPRDDDVTIRIISKFRLRRKTEEEKARERTDQILAKNAPVGQCVVCKKDIFKHGEEWMSTPHGLYHTACTGGKPDNYRRQWPEDY